MEQTTVAPRAAPVPPLDNYVHGLNASPLFNLSLASKELFHSNFLAWLCEMYPTVVGPVFARFTKAPCPSFDSLTVYRERHKVDLTIHFPNGESLIVENKVKSIASLEQLRKYSDKVKHKEHTGFLLLSLTRPSFVPANDSLFYVNETAWHLLSYSDIIVQLTPTVGSISAIDKYHGALLTDYIGFVTNLVAISSRFSVDWDNEGSDFFGKQERQLLEQVRLHDLVDKIRYGQLAEKIKDSLETAGLRVVAKEDFLSETQGVFMVDSALYQGEMLCEFKYLARDGELPVALGVMLQGNAVKVFVQAPNSQARRIAAELMSPTAGGRVWFDLARIPGDSREMPASGFNQYSGATLCLYRYKKIAGSSPKRLVDTLVGYACSIRNAEEAIRRQIGLACEPG